MRLGRFPICVLIVLFLLLTIGIVIAAAGHFVVTLNAPASGQNITGTFILNVSISGGTVNITNVTWQFSNATGLAIANFSNRTNNDGTNLNDSWRFQLVTTTLNEGLYNITAIASNQSGVTNSTNSTDVFIDYTKPTVALNHTTGKQFNFSTRPAEFMANATVTDTTLQTVFFNLTNASGQVQLQVGTRAGATNLYNASFNTTNLADVLGGYNITVIANDSVKLLNNSEFITLFIDLFKPNTTLSKPANNQNISGSFVLNVSVTDSHDVSTVQFNISNSTNGNVTPLVTAVTATSVGSQFNATLNTATIADGAYNVSVKATDSAGNVNETTFAEIFIDNTKPAVTLNQTNGQQFNFSTRPAEFMANATVTDSGIHTVLFNLSNASGQVQIQTGTRSGTQYNASFNFTNLADVLGGYNLTTLANDSVGNLNASEFVAFVIDLFKPNASLTRPANAQNISGSFVLNASVADSHSINSVFFNISNSTNGNVTPLITGVTSASVGSQFNATLTTTTLSGGRYNVSVRATDSSGNVNETTFAEIFIDNTKPAVTALANATANVSSGQQFNFSTRPAEFALNATVTDAAIAAVLFNLSNASGQVQLQTGTRLDASNRFNASFNTTNLADVLGGYNITVVANDSTNNLNSSEFVTLFVDLSRPNVTITRPSNTQNISGTFVLNASVADSHDLKTVVFNISNSTNGNVTPLVTGVTAASVGSQFNASFNTATIVDGRYNISVRATDSAGNVNETTFVEIGVDNTNIAVTINTPANNQAFNASNTTVLINATVTDSFSNIAVVVFNISNKSGQVSVVTGIQNGNLFSNGTTSLAVLAEGAYNITVIANNSAGQRNASESVQFFVDRTNPTFVSFTCADTILSGTATCTCTANDTIDTSVTTAVTGNADSGTTGVKSATCTATDDAGNDATDSASYNVAASASTGGGGGGGGSSTPTDTSSTSASVSHSWGVAEGGSTVSVDISNSDLAVSSLDITMKNTVNNLKATIASYTSKPAAVTSFSGTQYQYIEIIKANAKDSDITSALVSFSVTKTWATTNGVDPKTVALYRYVGDKWTRLTTKYVGASNDNHIYEAVTPGFSFFVIGTEKATSPTPTSEATVAPSQEPVQAPTQNVVETTGSDSQITGAAVQEATTGTTLGSVVVAAAVLSLLVVGTVVYFVRRKKR